MRSKSKVESRTWRWLALFLFLTLNFGLSAAVQAQGGFTTVTGTITGPDGIVWACGSISAQLITAGGASATLNGGGFTTQTSPVSLGCPTTPGTGAPGSFAMRLADSGVINPSNTTWQFTVNMTPGIAPPAGTGPQSFTFTTAINCSTNTPSTCTANSMSITAQLSAAAPKLSNSSGGGATPAPGSQISFGNTVSPYAYGAKGGVKYIYDAGYTNALPDVTSPNADAGWTAADASQNKIIFGTQMSNIGSQIGNGLLTAQNTIATFVSATHITMSGNANATCAAATTVLCTAVWGAQDDTTAINNAVAAAMGTSNPGKCQALEIPSDAFFISGPIANLSGTQLSSACGGWTSSSATSGIDTTQTGPEIFGQGPGNSIFVPLPSYSFAGCGTGCNFTIPNLELHDLGIYGFGQTLSTSPQSVSFVQLAGSNGGGSCTGSTGFNLTFAGYGVQSTGSVGLNLGALACGDPVYTNIVVEQFGKTNCQFNSSGIVDYTAIMCFGAPGIVLSITCSNGVNIVNTNGGTYTDLLAGGATVEQAGCQWNSNGDAIQLGPGGTGATIFENGAVAEVANLTGDDLGNTNCTGCEYFLLTPSVPGTVLHVKNTQFQLTGALSQLFSANGTAVKYFDDDGNTYTLPGTASTFTGDIIADGHSAKGIGTGSCTASSTLGLRVSGTTTAGVGTVTTCTNSAALDAGLPANGARTLALFQCKVKVAGTTSSTCTVLVNGSASTLTCTLAAAAVSCVDTVHSVALSDGDLVSLEIVTGLATTPSGATAIATWQ